MSPLEYKNIIEKIRKIFGDDYNTMFTDGDISFFIDEAQREYCMLSSTLVNDFSFSLNESGVYDAPSDFLKPKKVFIDNREIPIVSCRDIIQKIGDFRHENGPAQCACFDFDTWGRFRIILIPKFSFEGHLLYERFPTEEEKEVVDTDAIVNYCLYIMNLISNTGGYQVYYNEFMAAVNERNGSNRLLNIRSDIHRGNFL